MNNPSIHQLLKDPRLLLAFGFGSGLSPITPGTMGTLVAVPLYLLFADIPLFHYAIILLVTTVFGVYLCRYASNKLGVHDHKGIVWDEFVGFWITMFAVPSPSWSMILVGFVVFRFFDMVKPWPISVVDKKVHGGIGIMFDDILAGAAACGVLHLLIQGDLL